MIRLQQELDATVYSAEVKAQEYEQTFVRLWDQLLIGDRWATLAAFDFDELVVQDPGPPEAVHWGWPKLIRAHLAGPQRRLSHDQFKAEIARLAADGWEVVQTEWHHAEFTPAAGAAPARSIVSCEIHAQRGTGPEQQRAIVRGRLAVEWSPRRSTAGFPVPAQIEARDFEILAQTGPPAFAPLLDIDPRRESPGWNPQVNPLILYDLDGDGLCEIILGGANLVYWNRGGGRFEKRAFLANGIPPLTLTGVIADFTGDGQPDLVGVALADHRLRLYPGSAGGQFTKASRIVCAETFAEPQVLTAGDFDADGDLDLFAAQYKTPYRDGQMPTPYYDANDGNPSFLLANDGHGAFTDVTEQAGLSAKRHRRTYSASLVDLDDDGDLDLIVVSDFAGLDLYLNDGRGHFTDVTGQLADATRAFGMSHAFGDFNGDGLLDFYMIGMSSTTARRLEKLGLERPGFEQYNRQRMPMAYGNRMYLRQGGRFVEPQFRDSVARTGWSWGATAADFDNDGDTDIFVGNGHLSGKSTRDYCTRFWCHDIYMGSSRPDKNLDTFYKSFIMPKLSGPVSWNGYEHDVLFLNDGGRDFHNVAFLGGVGFEWDSRAVVSDDLDGDGRLDLLVSQYNHLENRQMLHVMRNQLATEGHWIGVRLREEAGHPSPVGARVTARAGKRTWTASVVTGDSFTSQHANTVHFGLGPTEAVDRLEVRWPDGRVIGLDNPRVDRYHLIQASP